jgi:predicted metal-dependent phosphoesterase TrpH
MLRSVAADLHVHTVLSACAEVEMIPPLIVRRAQELGLGMIAVTDHNASDNAEALICAAAGSGVHVLPGMELQTREEVHLLCLFDRVEECRRWQEEVFARLPAMANNEDLFGAQYVVDYTGDWIRTEQRLLATSADISLEDAVRAVHSLGGLAIPAHVDRPSFSLLANLGFVPEGLRADGLEVTPRFNPRWGFKQWPQLASWPLVIGGDAHRLSELGCRTVFTIQNANVEEISLALRSRRGRAFTVTYAAN